MAKRKIRMSGVEAEIDSEEISEISEVNKRSKPVEYPIENYATIDSIEAEDMVNKGFHLIGVTSATPTQPKKWVFKESKGGLNG